jgi:protoheme IX farnesyltransferase
MSLVIGCGCVLNNIIDRGIDRRMARTEKRALVTGRIKPRDAAIFGVVLGSIGFALLALFVNILTVAVGAVGLFFYLVMYGVGKRRDPIGTVIGSVSGAAPIAGGYTAATGRLDGAAVILFLSMVCWQMPHFFAIAMYRLKDYQAARLPVLPVRHGSRATKIQIVVYILLFGVAVSLLTILGYTGYVYLSVMVITSAWWLKQGIDGFRASDEEQWARHTFLCSLIVLLVFCAAVSVGALLP